MKPRKGELYRFEDAQDPDLFTCRGLRRDGRWEFENQRTGRMRRVDEETFCKDRVNGRTVRVSATPKHQIHPLALAEADPDKLTGAELKARKKQEKKLERSRTLLFYCKLFDTTPGITLDKKKVYAFLRKNRAKAREAGFVWVPSYSTLVRALEKGEKGNRSLLQLVQGKYVHDPKKRYLPWVIRLRDEMVSSYWAKKGVNNHRKTDAVAEFVRKFKLESEARVLSGEAAQKLVSYSTLVKWINSGECRESYALRYSQREADRRFRGHGESIKASYPLQYVMIDDTRVDEWVVLLGEDGEVLLVERPWVTIAFDVYSDAVLAAVFTFEPPSVATMAKCIRELNRPKDFLVQRFGDLKAATDCWGMPESVILDNSWDKVSTSFQVLCEAVGINVEYAAIKTPEHKSPVERKFDVWNERLFHRVPGGVPDRPDAARVRKTDPKKDAKLTLGFVRDAFWGLVVTQHHLDICDRTGLAPAVAFRSGLEKLGDRPVVDDFSQLDRFLGATENVILTAEGVSVRGERFHDSAATTALLDRLLKYSAKRDQRTDLLSSGRVPVLATLHPADCGYVDIWDFSKNEQVRLPNIDIKPGESSWFERDQEKKHRKKRQDEYETWDDALVRRAEYNRSLDDAIRNGTFRDARKYARVLEAREARESSTSDKEGETGLIECDSIGSIPMTIPAFERTDDRRKPKAPRRGGNKAAAKSKRTRANNRKAAQQKAQELTAAEEIEYSLPEELLIKDPASMLEQLARERR
ncbi:hypothetical protein [Mesorhizobium sp.]|uniref:hypothetical protein n=1 Tax=Mesorhizobium sp. TaxID=1871066 RepID=UPI0025F67FBD|nr:hypothetical protein [Mesorhizobium sp.]